MTSGRYAASTTVPVDRTRSEIERTLVRYGADEFAYGWGQGRALVSFRIAGRLIRIELPLPDRDDRRFTRTPTGKARTAQQAEKEWEQACRASWRALALVIKAKLEATEAKISTVEQEFLAWVVLPDGSTAGEWMAPQIERAYTGGAMPSALPALGTGGDE